MTSPSADSATAATPALVVQDVVAGYGGGDVLRGVSMEVADGGITCVVGPNGAGKSTLLGSICGALANQQLAISTPEHFLFSLSKTYQSPIGPMIGFMIDLTCQNSGLEQFTVPNGNAPA